MSEKHHTDAEQNDTTTITEKARGAAWSEYATLAGAAFAGLLANAVVATLIFGGNITAFGEGIAFLTPAVAIAAGVYHRYEPLDMAYLSPAVLFLTVALANTASLILKAFRSSPQADPVFSAVVLAFVGTLFAPGPFLAVWAVRRWYL